LDYRRDVRRGNLGYRCEGAVPGWFLKGVAEALRVFEFAPDQVGSALFVDGRLVNCFITPHPGDYAKLHETLLTDQYPSFLIHYGYLRDENVHFPLRAENVDDLSSLRREFERARAEKLADESVRLDSVLGRCVEMETLYEAGPFSLGRFITEIDLDGDNYCGELISRKTGQIEYLKLYHLSRAETRRLVLLRALASNDWNFEESARELGAKSAEGVARKLVGADLPYLLNPGVWGHLLKENFV
jgi:hypothetical protein